MEWKEVVTKAGLGALQAAFAEFAVVQVADKNTLYVAICGALLRGGVAFLSELQQHFKTPVKASRELPAKSLFNRCW